MITASPEISRALLDVCGQAVIVVDPSSLEILYANAEAAMLLECDAPRLIGMQITDVETGLQDHFYWEEVRAGNATDLRQVEARYRTLRNTIKPVERSAHRRLLDGLEAYVITARDITAARAVEDLAARTGSLLAATLESVADGLLVLDLSGQVVNFNRRLAELFRFPDRLATAPTGADALLTLRGQFRAPSGWDDARSAAQTDPARHRDYTFALADGRWLSCTVRPQMLRGHAIGVLYCFAEVTDRVRYQQALLTARDASDSANRAKSQFLSAMSHELKTPLNAILGFSQLLEFDALDSQQESLKTIRTAGEHLLSLINEVLDLASIEAGKIDLHIQQVEVAEPLNEALAFIQPLVMQRNVKIRTELHDDVRMVMADHLRLRQVLINLLSNAAKYSTEGSEIVVRLQRTPSADGDQVRIEVEDAGIGIAQEDLPRLFMPFSRLDNGREAAEGTGLGLALTQRLTELMRGTVSVDSTLGVGSRFRVDLPAG